MACAPGRTTVPPGPWPCRETTTMPLTTSPASTATVIRRSEAGSVPGPDVPTAGRERMSIGRLTAPRRGPPSDATSRCGRAGLLLAAAGQERGDGQAKTRHGQAGHGDRADRPPAPGPAPSGLPGVA